MQEVNYTFEGHRFIERKRGVVVLSEEELRHGDFSLVYVSKRLGRVLSEIPQVRNILRLGVAELLPGRPQLDVGRAPAAC